MMKIILLISLNIAFVCSHGYQTQETPPKFSDAYSVTGNLYIPFAEIKEPFNAWYDQKNGKSRVDYYGGMVKTYQLTQVGPHGTLFKIAPMTTEKVLNQMSCFQVNGSDGETVSVQSVIPDISEFKYLGEELVNGVSVEKWRLITSVGDKVSKYTLYIRYSTGAKKEPIPVRYEMKGYNSLLGSHYDHYYLDYELYSPSSPSSDVFEVQNLTCSGFPGPGSQHIATFNPMMEFIHDRSEHVDTEFKHFKRQHGKVNFDKKEDLIRRKIFTQNFRYIQSINRANLGYTLAINHLADRTDLELQALRGFKRSSPAYNGGNPFPYKSVKKGDYPPSFDWTLYGAVTPVKDQSVCGSCWSFGTTGAVEGAYFVKHKKQVILSQQALVDCSWGYGNNGCDGGEDYRSYEFIMKNGLPTQDDYGPYLGQDGYCHIKNTTDTVHITGFVNVTTNSEDALKLALAKHGPISVAIDASQKSFSFYSNGVYYDPKCKNTEDGLDHAVLLVGYGEIDSKPFWMIKNSWSNYWGNQGYVLISIKDNNCGVMLAPTYVNIV